MTRCVGATCAALLAFGAAQMVLDTGVGASAQQRGAAARGSATAPAFAVDPMWPKPMPNGWILGSITGVAVDAQDHIWVVHRGAASLTARTENGLGTDPPTAELCCRPAPPVLEFDQAGNLVSSWGGPGQGYDWPTSPGGIAIDPKGNVWITAAGADAAAGRGGRAGRAGGAGGAAAGAPTTQRTAATAATTADARHPHPEVLAQGRVPDGNRQVRHGRRQRQHDVAEPAGGSRLRRHRQRGLRRRRLRQSPRHRLRRRDRRLQAALGRVWRRARRQSGRLRSEPRRPRSSSAR